MTVKGKHHFHFYGTEKGRSGKLQASEPLIYAWENHGADHPGRNVKAHLS